MAMEPMRVEPIYANQQSNDNYEGSSGMSKDGEEHEEEPV
jgi:hypothetical protein